MSETSAIDIFDMDSLMSSWRQVRIIYKQVSALTWEVSEFLTYMDVGKSHDAFLIIPTSEMSALSSADFSV